jgi:hypothetical protein
MFHMLSDIVTIVPFTRINDNIHWNESINQVMDSSYPELTDIVYDNKSDDLTIHHQLITVQESFLYVCTETVFNYPHSYLSEKSYKGITSKRPFVILGAPNSLQLLKDYGFKTFDQWWDESYDSEQSVDRRLINVYAIIKRICESSIDELKTMCDEMSPILEYNFNHYNTFSNNEINSFEQQCINNLRR